MITLPGVSRRMIQSVAHSAHAELVVVARISSMDRIFLHTRVLNYMILVWMGATHAWFTTQGSRLP